MKILIVYYSLYGHVFKLAQAVKEGAESVKGAEVLFRRVGEFDVVLKKTADDKYLSQVREQQKDIPVCTLDDLRAADGVLIGSPTRYGNMTAQMKQLIDSTASLWLKGEMEGKPAGVFTCTASTHGGQETTLVTMMIPLLHLGMLIVGVPYSVGASARDMLDRPPNEAGSVLSTTKIKGRYKRTYALEMWWPTPSVALPRDILHEITIGGAKVFRKTSITTVSQSTSQQREC